MAEIRTPDGTPRANLKVTPFLRESVSDKVFETLQDAILSLDLPGGTRITEADLARQFGVSTTPIREALQRLVQAGLVDKEAPRGVRVHQMTLQESADIYELRAQLEPLALKHSAPHLSKHDLEELRDLLEQGRLALDEKDLRELSRINIEFHHNLIRRSPNQILLGWLESLRNRHRLISMQGWALENRSQTEWEEHKAILDALCAGQSAEAVSRLASHIRHFMDRVIMAARSSARDRA